MKSIAALGSTLGVTCLAATVLLASVNAITAGRIKAQAQAELQESLREVMADGVRFEPVEDRGQTLYYKVVSGDGRTIGAAFKASAKGYSSVIDTIVGMNNDGSINAIKIVSQQETPGLGSRITEIAATVSLWDFLKGRRPRADVRPWFQEQFSDKAVGELDGIQAITGATISSRTVIDSVRQKAAQIQAVLKQ